MLAASLEAEKRDGVKRVFIVDCEEVGRINKLYKKYVAQEILKLGRQHPLVRTQYFCEEIEAQAGMFNAARLALMQGDQPRRPTSSHPAREAWIETFRVRAGRRGQS